MIIGRHRYKKRFFYALFTILTVALIVAMTIDFEQRWVEPKIAYLSDDNLYYEQVFGIEEKVAVRQRMNAKRALGEYIITHYCLEDYPHICNDGESSHTASGEKPIPDYTVAADKSIPFGTMLIIDGVEYEVMERGGAITDGRLDIAVETHAEAINRGRVTREVFLGD